MVKFHTTQNYNMLYELEDIKVIYKGGSPSPYWSTERYLFHAQECEPWRANFRRGTVGVTLTYLNLATNTEANTVLQHVDMDKFQIETED